MQRNRCLSTHLKIDRTIVILVHEIQQALRQLRLLRIRELLVMRVESIPHPDGWM